MAGRLIDISQTLRPQMWTWPGDTPFELNWDGKIDERAPCNLGSVHMSLHTGTHTDTPFHFERGGASLSEVPLDVWIGPARVIDARGCARIGAALVAPHAGTLPLRVLFKTGSYSPHESRDRWTGLARDGALALVQAGVKLVGLDTPSVDEPTARDHAMHRLLAHAGVVNLEYLQLDAVDPGDYELVALPLKLQGMEASPVRAVLRGL